MTSMALLCSYLTFSPVAMILHLCTTLLPHVTPAVCYPSGDHSPKDSVSFSFSLPLKAHPIAYLESIILSSVFSFLFILDSPFAKLSSLFQLFQNCPTSKNAEFPFKLLFHECFHDICRFRPPVFWSLILGFVCLSSCNNQCLCSCSLEFISFDFSHAHPLTPDCLCYFFCFCFQAVMLCFRKL